MLVAVALLVSHNFHLIAPFWFLFCISCSFCSFKRNANVFHTLYSYLNVKLHQERKQQTALNGNLSTLLRSVLIKMQFFCETLKAFSPKNFVVFSLWFQKPWGYLLLFISERFHFSIMPPSVIFNMFWGVCGWWNLLKQLSWKLYLTYTSLELIIYTSSLFA